MAFQTDPHIYTSCTWSCDHTDFLLFFSLGKSHLFFPFGSNIILFTVINHINTYKFTIWHDLHGEKLIPGPLITFRSSLKRWHFWIQLAVRHSSLTPMRGIIISLLTICVSYELEFINQFHIFGLTHANMYISEVLIRFTLIAHFWPPSITTTLKKISSCTYISK